MHNEKITKLEQQFFYLAQNKSKDQQAPAHKAKIRNISLQKVFQHSSCSNSGHGSGSEASACFSSNSAMSNKSTPKKVQRPSKHWQSHKASHKRGEKKDERHHHIVQGNKYSNWWGFQSNSEQLLSFSFFNMFLKLVQIFSAWFMSKKRCNLCIRPSYTHPFIIKSDFGSPHNFF